jgi:hypothetical protein
MVLSEGPETKVSGSFFCAEAIAAAAQRKSVFFARHAIVESAGLPVA